MSKRLLLADDSITIQKVIGITFANEDYQLDIVDNGTSALEHARAHRPDAVLADVYMPGRNGYELCAAIKQDPQLQGVPVLLLAGTFEPFDEDKARQAGADGWIAKPFESQALIDRVEELIQAAAKPLPAAVAAAETEPAEVFAEVESSAGDEDLWAEPEALGMEEDGALVEDLEPLGEAPVAASEDVWGSISFEEEELVGDVAVESAPASAPAAPAAPPAGVTAPVASAADGWDEEADEIFDLEDDDIIDEADLIEDFEEPLEEAVPVAAAREMEFEVELGEPIELGEAPASAAGAPAWVDEYGMGSQGADGELELDTPDFAEPAAAPMAAEPEPAPSATPSAPSAAAAVTLDEAEVERIVARVAEEVIERLAGTLLERIAWEVVPDLAEGMIKDEIRKIKATLQ